jgi:hypothetical protein
MTQPIIPDELLEAVALGVYQLVTTNKWEREWPIDQVWSRCRTIARVALRLQRLREMPASLPGVLEALNHTCEGLRQVFSTIPPPNPTREVLAAAHQVLLNVASELRQIETGEWT